MKKKTKYSLFIGIAILIIIAISFIFFPQKKRFDEYLCEGWTGSRNDIFIAIDNEYLYTQYGKKDEKALIIREETQEKIYSEYLYISDRTYTFYKRSKKLKVQDGYEIFLLDCTKLN